MKKKGFAFVNNGNEPIGLNVPAIHRVLIVAFRRDKYLGVPALVRQYCIDAHIDDGTLHSLEGFHLVVFVNPNKNEKRATELSRIALRENVQSAHVSEHRDLAHFLIDEFF